MASPGRGGGKSQVWELLNSIKSRTSVGAQSSVSATPPHARDAETRRAALDGVIAALDAAVARGESGGDALYTACILHGGRGKAADRFVTDCISKRVLDKRNSRDSLVVAATAARSHLAVAVNSQRRVRAAAAALVSALDEIEC